MTDLLLLITLYALLSGSTIWLGGILSHYFSDHVKAGKVKEEIIHLSIAFGGGILMAAVGLVLVLEGLQVLSMAAIILCFSVGAISCFLIDRYIERQGGTVA